MWEKTVRKRKRGIKVEEGAGQTCQFIETMVEASLINMFVLIINHSHMLPSLGRTCACSSSANIHTLRLPRLAADLLPSLCCRSPAAAGAETSTPSDVSGPRRPRLDLFAQCQLASAEPSQTWPQPRGRGIHFRCLFFFSLFQKEPDMWKGKKNRPCRGR